jgi:hypothetical protein
LQDYQSTLISSIERDGGLSLSILDKIHKAGGIITGSLSFRS